MENSQFGFGLDEEIQKLIELGLKNGMISRMPIIHLLADKDKMDEYTRVISYMASEGVVFSDDDIDFEDKDDSILPSISFKPFDSTKINILPKPLSVEGLISRLKHNEINMDTGFQRKSGLWDSIAKSQLIESLMLRIPLPVFYFDGTKDHNWLIIDGLQRLTVFKQFFIDKTLILEGLEYFSDYNGCKYEDLPRTYIRRMEETQLFLYIVQSGTPDNVKFNIYKRINTRGLELEPQEIRHALFQGKATKMLKDLAESEKFREVTGESVSNERMLASEIVLRFLAFEILGTIEFDNINGQFSLFLNEMMSKINAMADNDIMKYEQIFYSTLDFAKEIFGKYAFRRITSVENSRKNPFNVALYESWMLAFSKLSDYQKDSLLRNKNLLLEKFLVKLGEKTFSFDISSAKKIAVLRRIDSVKKIVDEVLADDK